MPHHDATQVMELYPRIYFACHTRHVRDEHSRRRLSAHQASILDHLDDVAPVSLHRLAQHMGVTASTMSLAITRLTRMGYVQRQRDRDDRRFVRLRLTADGLRIRESKSVLEPERVERMLAQLSVSDRRHALEGLALLARAAEQAMVALSARREKRRVARSTR